ncbi:MAG TPA: hypothetical protein VK327_09290 [Candidatus Paceibacterota bacterium]|nr:hypothetical protein [Candidatus Paceibacterota bacterium]
MAELPRLQAEVDFLKVNRLSSPGRRPRSPNFHKRRPKLSNDDKRKIAESIMEKMVMPFAYFVWFAVLFGSDA